MDNLHRLRWLIFSFRLITEGGGLANEVVGLLELEDVLLGVEEAVRVVDPVGLGDGLAVAELEGVKVALGVAVTVAELEDVGDKLGVGVLVAVGEDDVDRPAA